MRAVLQRSPKRGKRYRVIWYKNGVKLRHTDFGSTMSNFTIHKNERRKQRYLDRFRTMIRRYRRDPYAPTTLSTMILWNKPTIRASWIDYKQHFGFT